MYLSSLKLINFRSYIDKSLELQKGLNLIIGNNGAGKTNLLESVYYLFTTASHRTKTVTDLVNWEKDGFYISGRVQYDGFYNEISVNYGKKNISTMKLNGTPVKRTDIICSYPAVIFSPEDINYIKGSPSLFRRLVNINISQLKTGYIEYLFRYNRVLSERNAYLRALKSKDNLNSVSYSTWTEELQKCCIKLWESRKLFIEELNRLIDLEAAEAGYKDRYEIKYRISDYRPGVSDARDFAFRHTTWGAHRDIFWMEMNGRTLKEFGSRGESRIAMLLYKQALIRYIEEKEKIEPVILLDDVFSELDKIKRSAIKEKIRGKQVLMTSVSVPAEIDYAVNIINI